MGICLAIAAVVTAVTVATDIGFTVAEKEKQDDLKSDTKSAQAAINETNTLYQNVYKVVKTRLDHLKQSLTKLPPNVVKKLEKELHYNISGPSKVVKDIGLVFNIDSGVLGVTGLVSGILTGVGMAAVDGIIAAIGAVAVGVGTVLAVAGLCLTIYNGIKELKELNQAIRKVKHAKTQAEEVMTKMKTSLDGLISSLGLEKGKYETLAKISKDWATFAENFDNNCTAFYEAMKGFAMGKTEAEVVAHLEKDDLPSLNDDVLVLAKLIEENIAQMMQDGFKDEEIITFYYMENPGVGLHFLLDAYFLLSLRDVLYPDSK